MDSNNSYISQLKSRFRMIQDRVTAILRSSQLEHYSRQPNPFIYLGSNPPKGPEIKIRWSKLSPDLEREQNQIQKDYYELYTDVVNLFKNATREEDLQLKKLYLDIDFWIKYRKDSEIPNSVSAAIVRFEVICNKFISILDQLTPSSESELILVIDTSAIIDCPDISQMSRSLSMSDATFILPSTTLKELDDLKTGKRDESFRQRLTAAINNINELMSRGSILEGISLQHGIIVRALAAEPDFSSLPKWLDPQVNDDRIIASAIELQRSFPTSVITILANDINMQNKAALAGISVMKVLNLSEGAD